MFNCNRKNFKTNGWGGHHTAKVEPTAREERDEGTEPSLGNRSLYPGLPGNEYEGGIEKLIEEVCVPVNEIEGLSETRPSSYDPAERQHFKEIRSRCVAEGRLFEDDKFPAKNQILYYPKRLINSSIQWLRPREICENPQLFVEGYSRFDVHQGAVGDCWLVAAVANLTLHRKLFRQVVPDDQSFDEDYAGVFHFRFWQHGSWVDVVVDDRLPTYEGKLLYLHSSQNNEFWPALLEKAYAKLHGSYKSVVGGAIQEALQDFTGGLTELYSIANRPPNFFTFLIKAYERNSLIGCAIEKLDQNDSVTKTPENLYRGHAYSLTKVKYIETRRGAGKIPLLRLRNPWGNDAEWNGAWSDKSREWQSIDDCEMEEIGLTFDHDGEFWMTYEDFVKNFSKVEMCHLNPNSLDPQDCPKGCTKKWEMSVYEGKWVKGITAGGCMNYLNRGMFWQNPQCTVTLKDVDEGDDEDKCTIIIALMQKNRRHRGLANLSIGFAIYRLPDYGHVPKPLDLQFFKHNLPVAGTGTFTNLREVSARFKLDPGSYVIVPSTFKPNEEGEFLLRVFSEKSNNMAVNDNDIGMGDVDDRVKQIALNPEPTDPVGHSFNRLGDNGEVDWRKLKEILNNIMAEELKGRVFSNSVCRLMIAMLDKDGSGGLGFEEFKSLWFDLTLWQAVFHLYEDKSRDAIPVFQLRNALHSAGFTVNAPVLIKFALGYCSSDGYIEFDDFIMCLVHLKTMIGTFKGNEVDALNVEEWLKINIM